MNTQKHQKGGPAVHSGDAETRSFTVPGNPVGKGRPKFSRTPAGVRTYTPEKTVSYEALVKWAYIEAYQAKPMLSGPVTLYITAYYAIPKSWSKKKQQLAIMGDLRPVVKPDADNIVKIISDALNGLAYKDDAQVVTVSFEKWYGDPMVNVELRAYRKQEVRHEHHPA